MLKVSWKKIILTLTIFIFLFLFSSSFKTLKADDTPTPTPGSASSSSGVPDCAKNNISKADCPRFIQEEIDKFSGQEDSVQNKIDVMAAEISLTEARIESTKQQILDLTADIDTADKKINGLQSSLTKLMEVLINRIVATYETGTVPSFQVLVTSTNISNFFTKLNYLKIAQTHDKELIYNTEQAKIDYSNQKNIFEDKKKQVEDLKIQLEAYNVQLDQQKQEQQVFLAQVQQDKAAAEQQYQQALAELAGFSHFVTNQGGASILSNQTSCDDWGCYYNQRDSQWGNILINNQSGYSMAGYGCLITSVAMVASHVGRKDILPSDIAQSGDDNFQVSTAMLKYTIHVKGVSISRNGISSLDSALQNGPVIVGIYAYGGTHFVVIKSGSSGSYTMNDPFIEGGHDISFSDHYSLGSIFEMDTISM